MNNKYIHTILFTLLCALSGLQAQVRYNEQLEVKNLAVQKQESQLILSMDIDLSDLELNKQHFLVLTPVLQSLDGDYEQALTPVVITGKVRHKAISRSLQLHGEPRFKIEPREITRRENGKKQLIPYNVTLPRHEWMNRAALKLRQEVHGCAECDLGTGEVLLAERIIAEPYQPSYKLTYIVPEAEPVKARSDRHSASFNYRVGRHELLRDFQNNAAELNRVDRVINEVKGNKDLEITEFTVSGYASPEGNYNSNRTLSDRRANSFADYLSSTHGIARDRFRVTGLGEDWNGLKEAVEKSSLADKNEIIHVINNVSNPDARDAELKKLSGGQTYRTLLNTYYPPLRRTDYTIAYTVRPFSVEEAKGVIRTNPRLLSLNEMFLVAQTYAPASGEFKEVFDIATRLYPDEPIAILNSAAADIEGGNNQAAIDRLNRIESDPRAWNNLGVAYIRLGDTTKAMEYFQRAADQSDSDAEANLQELQKHLESL